MFAPRGRYRILERSWDGPADPVHNIYLLTLSAATQTHVDTTRDEAVAAVNGLNATAGLRIALLGNSPIWNGKDSAHHAARELFWDWSHARSSHPIFVADGWSCARQRAISATYSRTHLDRRVVSHATASVRSARSRSSSASIVTAGPRPLYTRADVPEGAFDQFAAAVGAAHRTASSRARAASRFTLAPSSSRRRRMGEIRHQVAQPRHPSQALLPGLAVVEHREHGTGVAEQLRGQRVGAQTPGSARSRRGRTSRCPSSPCPRTRSRATAASGRTTGRSRRRATRPSRRPRSRWRAVRVQSAARCRA
jgi:Glutamate-cysteine ligase family 2(GCS2)